MNRSTERARTLRMDMTDAERAFWRRVRDRRFGGMKFRRQVPVGSYFADFLCYEKKIIVELDGGQHVERAAYDEHRTQFLESQGYQVVRFWDNDVLKNLNGVLAELARVCGMEDPHTDPLPPLPRMGEGVSEIQGYQVVRFWDNDVLKNMDVVLAELARLCGMEGPHPIPLPPLPRMGEGVVAVD